MRFRPASLAAGFSAVAFAACSDASLLSPAGPESPASASVAAAHLASLSAARVDTIAIGATLQLSASLPARRSKKNDPTSWSTSSAVIARVSQEGLVTGLAEGTATITADNGAGTQTSTVVVRSDAPTSTPPAPPPTSPAPTPTPSAATLIARVVGASPSAASIAARGGVWARYESDFIRFSELHWNTYGADYFSANYYDRAQVYYVWWARTGNPVYLERANALAINARTYIESQNYNLQPYQLMLDGVALHAFVTSDPRSVQTVLRTADTYANPEWYWSRVIGDLGNPDVDPRTQSRVLNTLVLAKQFGVPSPAGYDYAERLRHFLGKILSTQASDGAYRWANQCNGSKPYMSGMLNDALIRYYTTFEPDSRIPTAIRRSIDYLWNSQWVASIGGFEYDNSVCNIGGTGPTADLNGLIVNGFGFIAKQTGDASYFTKGDAIFAGGVNGAWLFGTKQFNQAYTTSYRYLGYRFP